MILRWTPRGFIWTLGEDWGENGPFETYREAIDDYEASVQAQSVAAPPPGPGVEQPREDAQAPTEPRSAPFSFLDLPLSNDA